MGVGENGEFNGEFFKYILEYIVGPFYYIYIHYFLAFTMYTYIIFYVTIKSIEINTWSLLYHDCTDTYLVCALFYIPLYQIYIDKLTFMHTCIIFYIFLSYLYK